MTPGRIVRTTAFYALVAVIVFYAVFPFYYAVISSLKPASQLFRIDYYPAYFEWRNYVRIFEGQPFAANLLNSILVSLAVVVLSTLLGITAAYALGRVTFRGRQTILVSILGVSMFPQVAVLSGMFELIRALGLYNNLASLALSYMIFTLPFTVWVLTTYVQGLPQELEEAAIMDGASPWSVLTRIFVPLMMPALVTTGLLAFIAAWNEFLFALTFTLTNEQRTVPVAISMITGGSAHELPWANIMAASVLVTVPVVALVLVFQKRIVSGLTAGAVKG
ncbi:carbohydrate ABC transporter permease [Pararobbsia silviterrae]|uniref:Carbohydrate ABC transporter permease n=2 Tax=Pararobbsia silviterrae TaxID=1792498 RepID=A0A494XHZ5_9BURK|nr:carbohydrate ABC transporter permease [Pararobbsia silviterrae]